MYHCRLRRIHAKTVQMTAEILTTISQYVTSNKRGLRILIKGIVEKLKTYRDWYQQRRSQPRTRRQARPPPTMPTSTASPSAAPSASATAPQPSVPAATSQPAPPPPPPPATPSAPEVESDVKIEDQSRPPSSTTRPTVSASSRPGRPPPLSPSPPASVVTSLPASLAAYPSAAGRMGRV